MLIETSRPIVMLGRRGANALGDLAENAIADGPAVEQPVVFHRRSAGALADGGFCFCRSHSFRNAASRSDTYTL